MRPWVSVLVTGLASAPLAAGEGSSPAAAASLSVDIEIPRLTVAEYHRPYVAVWLERSDQSVAANLAVWYQQKGGPEGEGTKWLKDMRQWWRKTGRDLQMPVDGVSGATRPAGTHKVSFTADKSPLSALAPGQYQLVVEAAREVGGRELLRVPFEWPAKQSINASVKGQSELGAVALRIAP
jgi:hypothetical protein